ncbi:FAD-binding protein [Pseudomonas sp. S31]|uniref:GMC family oxidoreductase n=1 Tax=Pseudomonas sp. S31 TaxID=1564473 RepID=UPI0019142176|nr:GMC family oxidoreductase N-terminal domain-containing protein [Pseudomonas sp. S31]MBK4998754.1 FAD-binding protein [Pseudomonas sp. S31]
MQSSNPQTLVADYVIVGGGSAGCVLANRLSSGGRFQVILLEAGGEADSFLVRMPAGMSRLIGNPRFDWQYPSAADASIGGRRFDWSGGRLLGGSSSINGQVYIRGSRSDYDHWAASGCSGWSFDECLPYFRRAEDFAGPLHPAHGQGGPLSVAPQRDPHPLSPVFVQACAAEGLATLDDYCGGDQHGAFLALATQREGQRCGTAQGYLAQARKRPNLRVLTQCIARRVLFNGQRAVGVEALSAGRLLRIEARSEVIVSAGTVGSPTLLMRSGVGPAAHLLEQGIAVVADLPGVGANLQEHAGVGINKRVNVPTYNSQMGALDVVRHLGNYLLRKRGPMVTPAVQAMACAKSRDGLAEPDLQLHFLPLSYDMAPDVRCSALAQMTREPTVMIQANVCHPFSRGQVRLRSADPDVLPLLSHQLLGDPRDLGTLVAACRLMERLFAADPLRRFVHGDRTPSPRPADDAAWERFVRANAVVCYHPVGTCRMGSDAQAVLDPRLNVRGVQGLRVVDASVMPRLLSANTNAAAIMIGERGSDFVLAAAHALAA